MWVKKILSLGSAAILFIGIVFISGCIGGEEKQEVEEENEKEIKELNVAVETLYIDTVMSGVHNQCPDLNISLIEYKVTNNEDEPVTLTFISEIQNYTSQSKDIEIIEPHSTKTIKQNPLIKPLVELEITTTASLYFKISSDDKIIDENTIPIKLYAKDEMIWGSWGVEVGGGEEWIDSSWFIGAWVTPHTPEIDELIESSARYHPDNAVTGYRCSHCQTDADWIDYTGLQVKAIYDALQNRYQITYINVPLAYGSKDENPQRVKLPKDTIKMASSNSIDGTVLFASALESVGINPNIILTPGHAFLCWDINEEGESVDCLETRMVGSSSYEKANEAGMDAYDEEIAAGNFYKGESRIISIKELREDLGVKPMG